MVATAMASTPTSSTVTNDRPSPTAPSAFVSYAHGTESWNATVLDFAIALRTVAGIDADLDQWHFTGGNDWTTYGPNAIETSNFILIAVSPTYKLAWSGNHPPGHNDGVASEAAAIKAIRMENHHDFTQRVKVVLLRGADKASIPRDLLGMLEYFEVKSFDTQGLDSLVRSILKQPGRLKPPLAPLAALPPHSLHHVAGPPDDARVRRLREMVADLHSLRASDDHERFDRAIGDIESAIGALAGDLADPAPDEHSAADGPVDAAPHGGVDESPEPSPAPARADDNRALADSVAARLEELDLQLVWTEGDAARERLTSERAAVKASLEAVERALPDGAARQRMVGNYLDAQLYFSAGAYHAANRRLNAVLDRLGDPDSDPESSDLEQCLRMLTTRMLSISDDMRTQRYAADTDARHPLPPDLNLETDRVQGVNEFYEVARGAMHDAKGALVKVRTAILRGREDEHAAGLYARFTAQQENARGPLGLPAPSTRGGGGASPYVLANAALDDATDRVAADVLVALAKAHLEIHLVEYRRSGTVGEILRRDEDDINKDKSHLRGSIALNSFALAITETLPWIFAADATERRAIQGHEETARRDLEPVRAMWPARQVTLLALYRRSHGFRLLGDHERAYDDLRKLQRIGRLSRLAHPDNARLTGWVDTLEALAEYRIGELYRADHDYMQALVHLCRSHDSVHSLEGRPGSTIARELGHLQIKLSLGKGKAFFEIGAMKRSLKWHMTAWRWLLRLDSSTADGLAHRLEAAEHELDSVKHDPVLWKPAVQRVVGPVLQEMCDHDLDAEHAALEADILVRISHLLTAIRLEEEGRHQLPSADSSARRCIARAAELDGRNLLVQTGVLRSEMHADPAIPSRVAQDPLTCWPSGASDVDQMIRVAEHLMLERLHAARGGRATGHIGVARSLMGHFMTHTDSINLRGAILHRYLMRQRAEERGRWYDGADPEHKHGKREPGAGASLPYLEFVCLRRFGSFTPFMPRPAAVSAVGGGYLVRVVRPPADDRRGRPSIFNIVVDPGEGAVNNLYAMGLSISDIDMVMATHDHPEHLAALDAILSLRDEFQRRKRAKRTDAAPTARRPASKQRLLILGNRSVVNRYSFLNGDGHHLVQHIADASELVAGLVPEGLSIEQLKTRHQDLGGHHASGFILSLATRTREGSEASLRIAFMADTAIEGLHEDQDRRSRIDDAWGRALQSDVLVAHVSDVPIGELRKLAQLPPPRGVNAALDAFDKGVRKLARERSAEASQIMHALSLVSPDLGAEPVSLMEAGTIDGVDQLYLSGLLEVCQRMHDANPTLGRGPRILIVGELREQLGSFRGTIAREINRQVLKLDDALAHETWPPVMALTADIGLRIRVTAATVEGEACATNAVLCSTCSYNNDRLDMERFHAPQKIREVCIKGDHEAMYWNCDLHDPGTRQRPKFVEQMGGYNPFAAGGRYHG